MIDDGGILLFMKRLILPSVLAGALLMPTAVRGAWLDAATWSRPRDGDALRHVPALVEVLEAFGRAPGGRIVIRYPGGEEGVLWVRELRSWLVALGVPSDRIDLLPGSARDDALELTVRRAP